MYPFSYLEPVCCSMSSFNCGFLTCIQISQEVGQVVWYSHLFQNFSQFIVIHKVKGFGIVNKAEIDIFLELSCFFDDPEDVGNLISVSCAFSITMTAAMKLKDTYSWKESYDQPRQYIEKQRHYFVNKGSFIQGYGFSSGHVWMWELDYKESWAPRNWWFWTVVLEKNLESPLNCKEIQPVHSKGDQSWVFIGRTAVEAETPILWPPDAKSWLIWKDPDAGRDWGQEEKGMTEDEMAGWHHRLDAYEFGWTLGIGDGQGGLACCNSWDSKSWTQLSDWTELNGFKKPWEQCAG